jgi:hypothetical protein
MNTFPAISKGDLELGIVVERQDSGEMTHSLNLLSDFYARFPAKSLFFLLLPTPYKCFPILEYNMQPQIAPREFI